MFALVSMLLASMCGPFGTSSPFYGKDHFEGLGKGTTGGTKHDCKSQRCVSRNPSWWKNSAYVYTCKLALKRIFLYILLFLWIDMSKRSSMEYQGYFPAVRWMFNYILLTLTAGTLSEATQWSYYRRCHHHKNFQSAIHNPHMEMKSAFPAEVPRVFANHSYHLWRSWLTMT